MIGDFALPGSATNASHSAAGSVHSSCTRGAIRSELPTADDATPIAAAAAKMYGTPLRLDSVRAHSSIIGGSDPGGGFANSAGSASLKISSGSADSMIFGAHGGGLSNK